ncbi:MAG: hypothetical protein AAFN78_02175 [Pseudomonadota bacterium]
MSQSITVAAAITADKLSVKPGEAIEFQSNSTLTPMQVSDWTFDREETDFKGARWQYEVRDSIQYKWRFEKGSPAKATGRGKHTVSFDALGAHRVDLAVRRVRKERKRTWRSNSSDWSIWHRDVVEETTTDTAAVHVEVSLHHEGLNRLFDPNLDPDGNPLTALDRKYWRVFVPDFNGADPEAASSFLRLGAVEPAVYNKWANVEFTRRRHPGEPPNPTFAGKSAAETFPTESGEDLAALVMDFDDDYRHRDNATAKTREQRKQESSGLHTRGGWRDHTDGNRITTTRGDKVEVIAGNYKRIVLGRRPFAQGDHTDAQNKWGDTLDISGGVAMDIDQTPFATTDIRWNDDLQTWKVTETGSNGYYVSHTQGISIDHFHGRQESYTAGSVYSYHGEPGNRIGHNQGFHRTVSIPGLDLLWPDAVDSPFSPEDEEQKAVDVVDAEAWNYHRGNLYERSVNELIDTQAFWGTKRGVDIGGVSAEMELAIAKTALNLIVETIDINIGNKIDMTIGQTMNLRLGPEMNVVTSTSQDFALDVTNISLKDTVLSMGATMLCLQYKIN